MKTVYTNLTAKNRDAIKYVLSWGRQNWNTIRFCLLFALYLAGIYFLIKTNWVESNLLLPLSKKMAQLTNWLLNILGLTTQYYNSIVFSSQGFAIEIINKCTGILQVAFFASGVLAYRCPFIKKIPGFITGILVISVFNLTRIVTLFFIGVYAPSWFAIFHGVIWEFGMIIVTFSMWLFWLKRVNWGKVILEKNECNHSVKNIEVQNN
ncbi:MAG: hypothetical protein KAT34_22915 [Candidatus Aminicenantes bacterium]|nr:hypothetical protein [Candidatus Aminicenantes bacterium]